MRLFPAAALAALVAAASPPVSADTLPSAPAPLDRWSLSVGGFDVASDTTISASAGMGEYTAAGTFSLEDDLGLDDRQPVAHVRFEYATEPKQALWLEYFG